MLEMNGSVALVTGASSGLGEHFAEVLARSGARVVAAARRTDKLDALVGRIQASGGDAIAVAMDVTSSESVSAAFDAAEAAYGVVTTIVNNAGVTDTRTFLKADEEGFDFVMDTNLKGVWRVAHTGAKRMVAAAVGGSIVNVASILGLRVGIGESTYAISKAGVVQMTKALAMELVRKNIRVNALCPGYFVTELNSDYFASQQGKDYIAQTPARRLGQLSELDAPLLLLASNAGSFVTGVALPVDGGHLVSSL
jgi:NAD(P)-dependent dehydrogenase (short-subunit alcohol dehydrogenase family)